MIEVRIRLEDDLKSVHLGEVPFTDAGLTAAIDLLNRWSIESDGPDYPDFSGQFVLTATGAFFEIIVNNDE